MPNTFLHNLSQDALVWLNPFSQKHICPFSMLYVSKWNAEYSLNATLSVWHWPQTGPSWYKTGPLKANVRKIVCFSGLPPYWLFKQINYKFKGKSHQYFSQDICPYLIYRILRICCYNGKFTMSFTSKHQDWNVNMVVSPENIRVHVW